MKLAKRVWSLALSLVLLSAIVLGQKIDSRAEEYDVPRVIITDYSITDGVAEPGKPFTLTMNLFNPSYSSGVTSVFMTLEDMNGGVTPVYGTSNQVYVDKILPRNTQTVTLQCVVSEEVMKPMVSFDVSIEYFSLYSYSTIAESAVLQIPIGSTTPFKVMGYDIPSEATFGAMSRLSVQYRNASQKEISNVVLHINGSALEEQTVSIGTLMSGASDTAEVYVYYLNEGEQTVTMEVTYTDADGEQLSSGEIKGNVVVSEAIADVQSSYNTSTNQVMSNFQIVILFLIFVILCIILVLNIKKRKR